jgi:hypothetical protein
VYEFFPAPIFSLLKTVLCFLNLLFGCWTKLGNISWLNGLALDIRFLLFSIQNWDFEFCTDFGLVTLDKA